MSGKGIRMSLRLLSPESPFIAVEYLDGRLRLGFSKDGKEWTWLTTDGEVTYCGFPKTAKWDSFEQAREPVPKWEPWNTLSSWEFSILQAAARLGHNPGPWKSATTDYFKWSRYVHCLNCGKTSGYDQDGKVGLFTEKCTASRRFWIDSGRR